MYVVKNKRTFCIDLTEILRIEFELKNLEIIQISIRDMTNGLATLYYLNHDELISILEEIKKEYIESILEKRNKAG